MYREYNMAKKHEYIRSMQYPSFKQKLQDYNTLEKFTERPKG